MTKAHIALALLAAVALCPMSTRAQGVPGVPAGSADYVIAVSFDGLRGDAVPVLGPAELPNFYRLQTEGAFTFNARTDHDYQSTLPNHTTMVTGRPVLGPTGHQATRNSSGETIHAQAGFYVHGMYDVAADAGLRTAMYASKSKFDQFAVSYPDKIGTYYNESDLDVMVDRFIADMQVVLYHLSLVHIRQPDSEGHNTGWNLDPSSPYMNQIREGDAILGRIFELIEQNSTLNGRTAIIVTSDHGGNGTGHGDKTNPDDYTIPFFVWGPGVEPGTDLYTLNDGRRGDPGTANPDNDADPQPIRDGDLGNLTLDFLGLSDIPGSSINTDSSPLAVNRTSDGRPAALFSVDPSTGTAPLDVAVDASASFDSDGTIVTYAWDFGDGTLASGVTATHTYANPGAYTIELTVTDDEAKTDDAVADVLVRSASDPVTVVFQDGVSPSSIYAGTRDTKLRSDREDTAHGSADDLEIDGSPDYAGLLQWDLEAIPQGAQIESASLHLFATNASGHDYHVYALNRDWNEAEATWLEFAFGQTWSIEGADGTADRGFTRLATLNAPGTGDLNVPLNADGLLQLQQWVDNPALNFGFIIENYDGASDGFDVASREYATASQRPALSVTYRPPQQGAPVADISATPTSGNMPLAVNFDGTGSTDADGTIVSYQWEFGDGSTGSGPLVTHTYSSAATFVVTLSVTDDEGKSGSASTSIDVTDPRQPVSIAFQDGLAPTASYAGTRDTKIKSDATGTSFGTDSGLEIDGSPDYGALLRFDLGEIPAGAEVTEASITLYGFNGSADTYGVFELMRNWVEDEATWNEYRSGAAWSTAGARGSVDRSLTSVAQIQRPGTGPVTFDLSAAGLSILQQWINDPSTNHGFLLENYDGASDGFDFYSREDGSASRRPRLQLTYLPPDEGAPTADFTATPSTGDAPLIVAFDGSSSTDDGFIVGYDFEFGDGSSFSGTSTSHTYMDPGTYTATLTVTDDEGKIGTASQTIVVTDPNVNTPPTAAASASPEQGLAPLAVTLSGAGSSDPDGSLVSFAWETGDDAAYSGSVVDHTYSIPGVYVATLTVTDDDGAAASSSVEVVVDDPTEPVTVSLQDGVAPSASYAGTRDAKIVSDDASTNFGSAENMEVDGSPDKAALLKWDLSPIPAGATIVDGAITLQAFNASGDSYFAFELLSDWVENEATWLQASSGRSWTSGGAQGAADRGSAIVSTVASPGTGSLTISLNEDGIEALQKWLDDPASNFGLMLANYDGASDGFDFYSRERGTPSQRPRLTITYRPPLPGAPTAAFTATPESGTFPLDVAFDASASSDADGSITGYGWEFGDGSTGSGVTVTHRYESPGVFTAALTVTDDAGKIGRATKTIEVIDPRQPVSVVFQDGVAPTSSYSGTRDTKILSTKSGTNFGSDDELEVDGAPDYGALIRWDVSSIPAGASVTDASITLSVFNSSRDTYRFYEVFRPWTEVGATWIVYDAGLPWATAGASGASDRGSDVLATAVSPRANRLAFPLTTAGVGAVQRWIDDPSTNHGFLIANFTDAVDGFDFLSREASDASDRPALFIEYLPPDGVDAVRMAEGAEAVSLAMEAELPESFGIASVYPNPFNPITTLVLDVPDDGICSVRIYDALGRLVQSHDVEARPGRVEIRLDLDGFGSGTYFVVATGPSGAVSTLPVALVK